MLRKLRFLGLVLLNVLIALIGTAILDSAIWKLVPTHSLNAIFYKESMLSVLCAGFIGFGMWRKWRSEAAKWTWAVPLLWFAFGLFAFAGHGIFGPLSFTSANDIVASEMRSFFAFTIPLIRAIAYSVGAYVPRLFTLVLLLPLSKFAATCGIINVAFTQPIGSGTIVSDMACYRQRSHGSTITL